MNNGVKRGNISDAVIWLYENSKFTRKYCCTAVVWCCFRLCKVVILVVVWNIQLWMGDMNEIVHCNGWMNEWRVVALSRLSSRFDCAQTSQRARHDLRMLKSTIGLISKMRQLQCAQLGNEARVQSAFHWTNCSKSKRYLQDQWFRSRLFE